jgi:hypothetical protein
MYILGMEAYTLFSKALTTYNIEASITLNRDETFAHPGRIIEESSPRIRPSTVENEQQDPLTKLIETIEVIVNKPDNFGNKYVCHFSNLLHNIKAVDSITEA